MEIFWYLVLMAVVVWGMFWLLGRGDWKAPRKPKMSKKLDPGWDKKFLVDLERWKKDRGAGV